MTATTSGGLTDVIDVHGHLSAPAELYSYKARLLSARGFHAGDRPKISDDEIREAHAKHLKDLTDVGTQYQLLSPRPYQLMPSEQPGEMVHWWIEENNSLVARTCELFPETFGAVGALPQVYGEPIENCLDEAKRCLERGFVGFLVNPDPSEATASVPTMADPYWFALYEFACENDVPLMIHGAGCRNERLSYSLHFINEESVALMAMLDWPGGGVFERFPDLRIICPHGGGSVPYQLGRWRVRTLNANGSDFQEALRRNVYFDTTIYSEAALRLLVEEVGADRVLFGTEKPGSGSAIDPDTGEWFDDVRPKLLRLFGEEQTHEICHTNARRVFSLDARFGAVEAGSDVA
jgi:OH-DDVA meta-cleavage compound hydrolase